MPILGPLRCRHRVLIMLIALVIGEDRIRRQLYEGAGPVDRVLA